MTCIPPALGAQIYDMSRPEFILAAGKMGGPVVQLDEEELKREFEDG